LDVVDGVEAEFLRDAPGDDLDQLGKDVLRGFCGNVKEVGGLPVGCPGWKLALVDAVGVDD
jgi:hypothetical protein